MKLSRNKKTYNFSFIRTLKWTQVRRSIFCPVKLLLLPSASVGILVLCLHWEDIHIAQVRQTMVVPQVSKEPADRLCSCIPLFSESQIKLKVEWNKKLLQLWVKTSRLHPPKTSFCAPNHRASELRLPGVPARHQRLKSVCPSQDRSLAPLT